VEEALAKAKRENEKPPNPEHEAPEKFRAPNTDPYTSQRSKAATQSREAHGAWS